MGPCVCVRLFFGPVDAREACFGLCVVATDDLNFEYNDRRKKIIPDKAQTKHTRASYICSLNIMMYI